MANLRSTVIVKTDICGYTARVKKLSQSDLSSLLNDHKNFISDISTRNEGSVIKGEGSQRHSSGYGSHRNAARIESGTI